MLVSALAVGILVALYLVAMGGLGWLSTRQRKPMGLREVLSFEGISPQTGLFMLHRRLLKPAAIALAILVPLLGLARASGFSN